ncbi:NADP-dependent oxidoreductase [Actinomadura parmotrematis]|uniref:NADP-dependent oxidoreductase n=1 Tax=Actinomadura parmotrematis TaxID=2864039 RepID=A0ABS7FN46_9ACTN|nr:NADP-dependent oxidoreductase [Actinomadura parmotrematis]MBW8481791.1 NADP-dependent oxidoreductase [Actinomadura parmotrematis]
MRAVGQDGFGGPEVLEIVEVERPVPGPAEVLVRVRAAAVNPTDLWHRATGGLLGEPVRLGWDVSGVVEEVGPGVTLFDPGDEVFGMPRLPAPAGAYAEYLVAPARDLARKPTALTHVQAAALPVAGLTAWQALVDTADVRAGQRVLVHAAAGGVGHLAVQIAALRGAHVTGTARAAKHAFVRGLGAAEVIDHTAADFAGPARDMDVVLDAVGGEYGPRSLRTLRPGGRLVALASPAEAALAPVARAQGKRADFMIVQPDRAALRELGDLAAAGRLHVEIAAELPLAEAAAAHRLVESGRTVGKVVLTVP